jgi:hypothetical protein
MWLVLGAKRLLRHNILIRGGLQLLKHLASPGKQICRLPALQQIAEHDAISVHVHVWDIDFELWQLDAKQGGNVMLHVLGFCKVH